MGDEGSGLWAPALNVKLIHCYLLFSASASPSPSLNCNNKNIRNNQLPHSRRCFKISIISHYSDVELVQ